MKFIKAEARTHLSEGVQSARRPHIEERGLCLLRDLENEHCHI